MKIMFYTRHDAFSRPGGDFVQLKKTKYYLEKMGYEIDISVETDDNLSDYNFVHIFNIQTSEHGIKQILNAKKYKKDIFLSPIYWSTKNLKNNKLFDLIKGLMYSIDPSFFERFAILYKLPITKRLKIFHNALKMLNESDVLLPNSIAELENIVFDYGNQNFRAKSFIIPNGVDLADKDSLFIDNSLPNKYVLQVASFTQQKGQLKTIESLFDFPDIPIVFIGLPVDKNYYDSCVDLGMERGNTFFINQVEQKDLYSYYHKAYVHVLPSMRESPGLVSMEASIRDTNCVVSTHGPINEYFGNEAFYCNPLDIKSIQSAILNAWESDINTKLKISILDSFTWKHSAQRTMEAYKAFYKK
jgi:glycosyltransferase involved in cell wall biosynthesis